MIKITKIDIAPNPRFATANSEKEYRDSIFDSFLRYSGDHLSPSLNFWAAGELLEEIEVDKPLRMERTIRNGIEFPGTFHTSVVTEIGDGWFRTSNSLYKIEEFNPHSGG